MKGQNIKSFVSLGKKLKILIRTQIIYYIYLKLKNEHFGVFLGGEVQVTVPVAVTRT